MSDTDNANADENAETEFEQYPADHPLVKTLAAQKELIKQLRAERTPSNISELREKAKKLDDLEEANKTEQEKLLARAEAAEKKLADREAKDAAAATAAEVAKEKGVPVSALRGSTREELEAHADELLSILPQKPPAPSADGQGNNGDQIGDGDMSADDIVAAATSR